jgi:SAM-dependent methyltransferase
MQTRNVTNETTRTDYQAVKQAILDYVEGVYEADPTRIEHSVHPDLAKRGFFVNKEGSTESIMSFAQFIEHTKTYNKDGQFPPDAPKEITIYEVLDHTASAKLTAAWGIDYMHLAKYSDRWMIVHVLWQTHPQNRQGQADSFNRVYGEADTPFYYGLNPSEELVKFLDETHPAVGEALDLGSGEGRNSLLLARYGYHVHAIDASSLGMQKLEKYAHAHGLDNINYTVADVRTVQLTPNFYDAIVAVTILDHISEAEGKKVAEAMIDALKAGGFVFIEVFTIHDPAASATKKENETISETASFVRHFFEDNELAAWFSALETIRYEEIMKYDDSHGEPHYHGIARLIARKHPT